MSVSSDILSSSVSKASKRSKETETGPAFMTIVKKKKKIELWHYYYCCMLLHLISGYIEAKNNNLRMSKYSQNYWNTIINNFLIKRRYKWDYWGEETSLWQQKAKKITHLWMNVVFFNNNCVNLTNSKIPLRIQCGCNSASGYLIS